MKPFFSILLPTKNRSEIVGGAIESALRQTFKDFELVISDNDDSDTATAQVVAGYSDPRIRYFRTSGKLAMYENWENVLHHAEGQYSLVLEDKMRLVENALEILNHHLLGKAAKVVSFNVQFAKEAELPKIPFIPTAEIWKRDAVIELFVNFSQLFFVLHPKGLDSCAPTELLKGLKKISPTGLVFSYICPDYASGFLLLSEVETILWISTPLIYVPNNWMGSSKYSNGQATYNKTSMARRFLDELPVSAEEIQQFSPVKSKWLWINMVIYDYCTKYRYAASNKINLIQYHAFCVVLVMMGKRLGSGMEEERDAIRQSLKGRSFGFRCQVYWSVFWRLCLIASGIAKKKFANWFGSRAVPIPP